jgi:hypothetical protein
MLNSKNKEIRNCKITIKFFKIVIYIVLMAFLLNTISSCEKSGQENNTVAVITTETVKEVTPETTAPVETTAQETVPPTTEVVETGPVEYEGVMINPIESLRFDNGTFFAREGNPYGLEAETKAGVFIKDAIELNGQMENSITLRPEVIEFLQKKMIDENHELRFALPINLKTGSGIKINIFEDKAKNDPSSDDAKIPFLGRCTYLGISGIQDEVTLFCPVKSTAKGKWDGINYGEFFPDRENNNTFELNIWLDKEFIENTIWEKIYPVHSSQIRMKFSNSELLFKEGVKLNPDQPYSYLKRTEGDLGIGLAKIFGPPDKEVAEKFFFSDYSILIQYHVMEYAYDENKGQYYLDKHVYTGEGILMEKDGIKVSFLPANE